MIEWKPAKSKSFDEVGEDSFSPIASEARALTLEEYQALKKKLPGKNAKRNPEEEPQKPKLKNTKEGSGKI